MSLPTCDCSVLIIGGGPVGLLLGNLLGARGVSVVLVEKRTRPPEFSMAIGVTPPSLAILRQIGLDSRFEEAGVAVRAAEVSEMDRLLGRLAFDGLAAAHPFILSIPQSRTVEILRRGAARFPSVRLYQGAEFVSMTRDDLGVTARIRDTGSGLVAEIRAAFVAGCDGNRSAVRAAAGIGFRGREYAQRWVMADFTDHSGLGAEARLFFDPRASVESFPLPGGLRRWIVLAPDRDPADPLGYVVRTVAELTGHDLAGSAHHGLSLFGARRMVADRYHSGRVVLCGDAAHLMSSVGGQGMNTGFGDAALLAATLEPLVECADGLERALADYDRVRRRAWRVAARRAEQSMWLGTRRGQLASLFRRVFIRRVLFSRWMVRHLAPHFAMLTIPSPPCAPSGAGGRA